MNVDNDHNQKGDLKHSAKGENNFLFSLNCKMFNVSAKTSRNKTIEYILQVQNSF